MIKFRYMKTPLHRYTFDIKKIRKWVEKKSKGRTLNLFAGKNVLDIEQELRVDINENMIADYHCDALEFVDKWEGQKFDTVILDPPYSYRKSMEMYFGKVMSPFNALKNSICNIINENGIVITFGYHSVSMGKSRGFQQKEILLMYHGGAIHDTIAVIEQFKGTNLEK